MVDYTKLETVRPPKFRMKYERFLEVLTSNFEVHRLRDSQASESNTHVCHLRHDIDFRMDWALALAEKEHDAGIHSTYFVLHTMPYFYQPDFYDYCKKIQDLGHEIGFHNAIISELIQKNQFLGNANVGLDENNRFKIEQKQTYSISYGPEKLEWKMPDDCMMIGHNVYLKYLYGIAESIQTYLGMLRNAGLDIVGTSAHGNPLCRDWKFQHYQLFKECTRHYYPETEKEACGVTLHTHSLSDFGLEYEAYFLKRDAYLSDGQDAWYSFPPHYDEWCPSDAIGKFIRNPLKVLKDYGSYDGEFVLQINTHPIWWFFDMADLREAMK